MARSSLLVTAGSFFSLLFGFLCQIMIAYIFGTTDQMDAFMTAFVIPGYFQALLLTGLPFVIVPLFVENCETGRESDAWTFVGTLIRLFGIGLTLVAILFATCSSQIISLSAPGLSASSSHLAARMLTVLIFCLPFSALGTISTGVQNARGSFFLPAFAPALGTLSNALIIVLTTHYLGPMSLAWGTTISAFIQCCVTFLPLLKQCSNSSSTLQDAKIKNLFRLLVPIMLFGLFGRATPLLERYFASTLPQGSISFLGYGAKVTSIFQAILGTGISTVVFPEMARSFTHEGKRGVVREYLNALRLTWVISLPFLALGSVLALPLIQLLLQRGTFSSDSAIKVALVLPILLGIVLCNILGSIIGRALYVQGKTFGFNFIGAVSIFFYPVFASMFLPFWGYVGLALSGLIVNIIGVIGGYCLVWHEIGVIDDPRVLRYVIYSTICSFVAWVIKCHIPVERPVFILLLSGCSGLLIYGALIWAFEPILRKQIAIRTRRLISKKEI